MTIINMSWHKVIASKIRELRLVCCQNSSHSDGVRNFISKNYFAVKEQAPHFPFIVRECENAIPLLTVRYDFGVEKKICIEGFSEQDVNKAVEELLNQADTVNSHRSLL
jgi:NADH dehydrogenase (ubiquinone) 1 alpha subcomplex subunit 2